MNVPTSKPALIGIDWGTTSLRVFLIDAHGNALEKQQTPKGVMQVPGKNFAQVLDRLLEPWPKSIPLIASGMITSRNGWKETPYISPPAGVSHVADGLVPLQTESGLQIYFVNGVVNHHKGAPDVMRGEETQLVGAVQSGLRDGLFVMPGTHSKWITVRDGNIVGFATYMSGEIYSALRDHTILGTLIKEAGFNEDGFRKGIQAGFDSGTQLLHSLFHVRTMPLFKLISEEQAGDYLSGMLIGAEIKGAGVVDDQPSSVTIIGRDDLANRYAFALDDLGCSYNRVPEDIVVSGHFAIATAAGLLN